MALNLISLVHHHEIIVVPVTIHHAQTSICPGIESISGNGIPQGASVGWHFGASILITVSEVARKIKRRVCMLSLNHTS